jgi:uncharacterized protein YggE
MKMNEFKLKLIGLALLITLFVASTAQAEDMNTDMGLVKTQGTAFGYQAPDTATVQIGVQTSAKTVDKAVEENKAKATAIINSLKKMINLSAGESIQTSSYRIQPQYDYRDGKNELKGYQVSNSVTVRLKEIQKIGDIISTATDQGANNINNISFSIENKQKYCKSLLIEATAEAKTKAEIVAEALGLTITGVKEVQAECGSDSGPRPVSYSLSREKAVMDSSTPIESGDIRLNSSVNIEFVAE